MFMWGFLNFPHMNQQTDGPTDKHMLRSSEARALKKDPYDKATISRWLKRKSAKIKTKLRKILPFLRGILRYIMFEDPQLLTMDRRKKEFPMSL